MTLTWLRIGRFDHSIGNSWQYDLAFFLKPTFFDHRLYYLDREFSVFLNLILKTNDKALAQSLSVEVLEHFLILGGVHRLLKIVQSLPTNVTILHDVARKTKLTLS
jgi:hypothetical protein